MSRGIALFRSGLATLVLFLTAATLVESAYA
ncbi:MAG: hypothetical protein FD129_861, partial [bacterium]